MIKELPTDFVAVLGPNRDFSDFTRFSRFDLNQLDDLNSEVLISVRKAAVAIVAKLSTYKAPVKILTHALATFELMGKGKHEATLALAHSIGTKLHAD